MLQTARPAPPGTSHDPIALNYPGLLGSLKLLYCSLLAVTLILVFLQLSPGLLRVKSKVTTDPNDAEKSLTPGCPVCSADMKLIDEGAGALPLCLSLLQLRLARHSFRNNRHYNITPMSTG